jgi:hypothetical protein
MGTTPTISKTMVRSVAKNACAVQEDFALSGVIDL